MTKPKGGKISLPKGSQVKMWSSKAQSAAQSAVNGPSTSATAVAGTERRSLSFIEKGSSEGDTEG